MKCSNSAFNEQSSRLREKSLAKKKYRLFQKRNVYPRIDIGFSKNEKFTQGKI
jgi:hypothetical protein